MNRISAEHPGAMCVSCQSQGMSRKKDICTNRSRVASKRFEHHSISDPKTGGSFHRYTTEPGGSTIKIVGSSACTGTFVPALKDQYLKRID